MELNLRDIFKKSFGYEAPPAFSISQAPARKEQSALGSPLYQTDIWGREFFLPVTINGLLIPFAVMSMNWVKKIVETDMPERDGEVSELISRIGHVFNIKGLLVDDNGLFPEQGITELYKLFQVNTSLPMRSALSDIVLNGDADHQIIIKEVKWPASAGVEHVKAFEIDVKEDRIFELNIK